MAYIDGFLYAVPVANRQDFIEYAATMDAIVKELGATRIVECLGDDFGGFQLAKFRRAAQAKEDEMIGFSWIEWPDKATRTAAMARMQEMAETDARFDPEKHPVPIDVGRMLYGGFVPVVEI